MTVGELLSKISSLELSEWMAYYSIEPFGEWRGDLRAGIVASTIANSNRGKNQRTYSPQDFMIDFEPRPRKTSKELYSMFRAWAESA